MQLPAGNGHLAVGSECAEVVVRVHGQRLFEPRDPGVRAGVGELFGDRRDRRVAAGEEFDASFGESLKNLFPKQTQDKIMPVSQARRLLYEVLADGNEDQVRVARNILEQLDS